MAVHKSWYSVLNEIRSYPKDDTNFFMIAMNKETPDETRTRFMTRTEAMAHALYEIEKEKHK